MGEAGALKQVERLAPSLTPDERYRLLDRGGHRLRHLHARRRRPCDQLEPGRRSASRATAERRSSASTSRASTPRRTAQAGLPQRALATAAARGQVRGRRLARAQGRHAASGRMSSSIPIRDAAGDLHRLRQDHARPHRAHGRPRRRCGAARSSSACWCRASPTTRSTCSIRTGASASWNAGAQRIKGYAPDEIIGQHFSRFYTEEDRAAGEPQTRARDRASREGRFEKEGWRVRKDGTPLLGQRRHRPDPRRRRHADRLRQDHARHHRAARGAAARSSRRARRCSSRRRWRRSASSPAASRTTSTIC